MKKVFCKKDFIGGNSTGELYFKKGLNYDCENFNDKTKSILIYDLHNRNSHYFMYYYFNTYFYTEQELRKSKLKKINETSTM